MTNKGLDPSLIAQIKSLSPEEKQELQSLLIASEAAEHTEADVLYEGTQAREMLRFAGRLSSEDAAKMAEIIDKGIQKIYEC